jgi:hypothetical protein
MAHFTTMFARHMLRSGAAQGWLTLAAWAVATGAGLWRAMQLHRRRAARHARSAAAHSVHALHLQLSHLDDDPETLLATAADVLLAAFPPGCSLALAEWPASGLPLRASADSDGSSVSSLDGGSNAVPWQAASASLAMPQEAAAPPFRSLSVLRVLARSPRAAAAAALDVAARHGCSRRGSAASALSKPGTCAGLTLDSDDFAEGAEAFADWYVLSLLHCRRCPVIRPLTPPAFARSALCAPEAAGPGTISLSLLGSGNDVVGGLWLHAPTGTQAPAPAALREYAECIGAVLLRARTHRALLRAAAAAARADADATLALQRAFLSGITHELRTPLNAVVGFTSTVLEGNQLAAHDAEYLRCSLTAANTLLTIIDQLLDFAKWGQASEQGGATALLTLADVPLRVRDVLDELVDVTGGKAATKGVSLCVQLDAGSQTARLRGDPARLRQVLVNLTGADAAALSWRGA